MSKIDSITKRFPSPLRYPGGKKILSKFLEQLLKINSISGAYCEGYAGGAGAALNLLFNGKINRIILNDADIHIYSFWNSILKNSSNFIKLLSSCSVTIEEWLYQKNIYENPNNHSELEVGFSTFFLNRANRGGILPKANPTGGITQKGKYKIDARFKIENLIPRIERIVDYKESIKFYNLDALSFIEEVILKLNPSDTLLYLDPPYYNQGEKLYLNYYKESDHFELAMKIKMLEDYNWLISYDNVKPIRNLYQGFSNCQFDINYSVQSRKRGNEIMYFSDKLLLPENLKIENRLYKILCPTNTR